MTSSFSVSQPLQLFKFPLMFKYQRVALKVKDRILKHGCIEIVPYYTSFHVLRIFMRKIPEDANHEDFLHLSRMY